MKWEKVCTTHRSDRGLVSTICKKLLHTHKKMAENTGQNTWIGTSQNIISMWSINMKRCSVALAIREMYIKANEIPLHTHQNGWNEKSKSKAPSIMQLELLSTPGWCVNWKHYPGKLWQWLLTREVNIAHVTQHTHSNSILPSLCWCQLCILERGKWPQNGSVDTLGPLSDGPWWKTTLIIWPWKPLVWLTTVAFWMSRITVLFERVSNNLWEAQVFLLPQCAAILLNSCRCHWG